MPSEANRLPVPYPIPTLEFLLDTVDLLTKSGKVFDAVKLVDDNVILPVLGVEETAKARTILFKLIQRRKAKKNGRTRRD